MAVEASYHWVKATRPVAIGMESAMCLAGPVPRGYHPSGHQLAETIA